MGTSATARSAARGPAAPGVGARRPSVCLISTYPPTRCGIASYAEDVVGLLLRLGDEVSVARVLTATDREPSRHPEVVGAFRPEDQTAMAAVARAASRYDTVVLQHEFGIYGPDSGVAAVSLAERLEAPVITVLHTVPRNPSPNRRSIIHALARISHRVVTLSDRARAHLEAGGYEVDMDKVVTVPHGTRLPKRPVTPPLRPGILTWGLISRNKGLERGIQAVAELADLQPPPLYQIVGRTHPATLANEGEAYRRELEDLVRRYNLLDMVEFTPTYVDLPTLAETVAAAEVVLLPYKVEEQVSSGVLIEALAAGKPVVATRFAHAEELLSQGGGILVNQGDIDGLSMALRRLLTDQHAYRTAAAAAAGIAQAFSWKETGKLWADLVESTGSVLADNAVGA